ncbi:integrin alpha-8 [Sesbania bispinosa]|nr:integrin alpha-8 [Sesbania bispinosa]
MLCVVMSWQFMHVNCSVVVGSEIETAPHATVVVLHARIELVIGSDIGTPFPRWNSELSPKQCQESERDHGAVSPVKNQHNWGPHAIQRSTLIAWSNPRW